MLFWFCILSESFWLSFQKFTLIPISRCQVAEDFSELDSDARSCSGLDSRNQLRSIYSKISNFYGSLIFPMFNSIDFIHRYFFPLPTSTARLLPSASPFSVSWMICNNNDKEIGHHQDSDNDDLFSPFHLLLSLLVPAWMFAACELSPSRKPPEKIHFKNEQWSYLKTSLWSYVVQIPTPPCLKPPEFQKGIKTAHNTVTPMLRYQH